MAENLSNGAATENQAKTRLLIQQIGAKLKEARAGVWKYYEAGAMLMQLLDLCEGHHRIKWLEAAGQRLDIGVRQLNRYMQFKRRVDELEIRTAGSDMEQVWCEICGRKESDGDKKEKPTPPASWPERLRTLWYASELNKEQQLRLRKALKALSQQLELKPAKGFLDEIREMAEHLDTLIVDGICGACAGRLPDADVTDAIPCDWCQRRGYVTVAEVRTGKVSTMQDREESQRVGMGEL